MLETSFLTAISDRNTLAAKQGSVLPVRTGTELCLSPSSPPGSPSVPVRRGTAPVLHQSPHRGPAGAESTHIHRGHVLGEWGVFVFN